MYRTKDGQWLTSTTPEGAVAELHKLSHTQYPTDREFMAHMAARAATQTGKRIAAGTAQEFVRSLIAVGLLLEEDA
jgi:hypothetical protein